MRLSVFGAARSHAGHSLLSEQKDESSQRRRPGQCDCVQRSRLVQHLVRCLRLTLGAAALGLSASAAALSLPRRDPWCAA